MRGGISLKTSVGISRLDTSGSGGSIIITGDYTVTDPNGATTWEVGDQVTINWTNVSAPVGNVDILISRNGLAGPFLVIASNVPDSGTYVWYQVVNPTSINTVVLIRNNATPTINGASAPFTIASYVPVAGDLGVFTPSGGYYQSLAANMTGGGSNGQTRHLLRGDASGGSTRWLPNSRPLEFCGWVKFSSLPSSGATRVIMGVDGGSAPSTPYRLDLVNTAGVVTVKWTLPSNTGSPTVTASFTPTTDTWYFLDVYIDTDTSTFGISVDEGSFVTAAFTAPLSTAGSGTDFYFGGILSDATKDLIGALAGWAMRKGSLMSQDTRGVLFNGLSPSQIKYSSFGITPIFEDMAAVWTMDEENSTDTRINNLGTTEWDLFPGALGVTSVDGPINRLVMYQGEPLASWTATWAAGGPYTFTQAVRSKQPTFYTPFITDSGGLGAVKFDGVDDYMDLDWDQSAIKGGDVIAVVQTTEVDPPAGSAGHRLWRFSGTTNVTNPLYPNTSGNIIENFGQYTGTRNLGNPTGGLDRGRMYEALSTPNQFTSYIDDGVTLVNDSNNITEYRADPAIGRSLASLSEYFAGYIAYFVLARDDVDDSAPGVRAIIQGFYTSPPLAGFKAFGVHRPNGQQTEYATFTTDESTTITWHSIGIASNVMIEFSDDNGSTWSTIVANTPNTGSYPWTVPFAPTIQGLVKVTSIDEPSFYDESDGFITIVSTLLDGAQASWDFNALTAGTNSAADQFGRNSVFPNGGTPTVVSGLISNGVQLGTSQYMETSVATDGISFTNTDFTVMLTFKITATDKGLVDKGDSNQTGATSHEYAAKINSSGQLVLTMSDGSNSATLTSTYVFATDTWHILFFGYDATANQIWARMPDGTTETQSYAFGTADLSKPFGFGRALNTLSDSTIFDSTVIFDRKLTAAEMQSVYDAQGGLGGLEWPFGDPGPLFNDLDELLINESSEEILLEV